MSKTHSSALPIAKIVLRVLIVLNWLGGLAIFALLTATFVAREWSMAALGIPPGDGIRTILPGLQAIAALGILAVPLNDLVLRRLLGIVATVQAGDPFLAANARRLQDIAWALLTLQLLSLVIGGIGNALSTPEFPLHLDAGFSTSGWLAVLMTFILARIFSEGAAMRDDLEGTI